MSAETSIESWWLTGDWLSQLDQLEWEYQHLGQNSDDAEILLPGMLQKHARQLIDATKKDRARSATFERIQWSGFNMFGDACCPVCEGLKANEEHDMGCELEGML